jgi:hypothetical protein
MSKGSKQSKVVMLHGWFKADISEIPEFLPDNPANWMGWARKELENLGYKVASPFVKNAFDAEYEGWKKEVEKK